MTRDCFEAASAFLLGRSRTAFGGGFEAETGVLVDAVSRFLADFDIEILRSVNSGVAPHHRSPTSAIEPAGQGSLSAFGAGD
jgi:hypothetical protein